MQKISLFNLFISDILLILESHDQNWHTHFWPCLPKNVWSTFSFFLTFIYMQKNRYSVCLFFMSSQFYVPIMKLATLIFDHSTSNISNNFLICMSLYQHSKNQLISSVCFSDTMNFRTQKSDCPHPFLTMPNQDIFNQLLIFARLFHQFVLEK